MALQTQSLVMVGLGVLGDRPPNTVQPPLGDGIHLRWAFTRELGFPWYGFSLFRRLHRPGTPLCLSQVIDSLTKGTWTDSKWDTAQGQLSSDCNLVLTDDFLPSGALEFDLDGRHSLRFTLPPQTPARRVEVRVGFRQRPGEPPLTRERVTLTDRSPGPGPNPRTEQGVRFEARDHNGKLQPNTRVRSVPGSGGQITGLDCGWGLTITLPRPVTFVELTITHFVKPATIEAFNADGSSAGTATMQDPRGRTPETVRVLGSAITRVAVYADQDETLLNAFCFGTARIGTVQVSAFSGDTPVGQTRVQGLAGDIASAVLEVDWITAVDLSAESAALIDLCTVPVSQEATVGWEQIPDFPYPMRLPVTHLSYPCTPGMNEDLARARDLARQRIRYGDPQQFTALPVLIPTDGTIAVTNGSPIVVGAGTTWTDDLVGAVLQIRGDLTAYAIIMVVAPNKLVLSRGYGDTSRSGAAYTIGRDTLGQFYNYLLHLVMGGSAAGPMGDRSLPMPIATTGTVAVTSGSQIVMGTGTAWRTDLTGLTFALAGGPAAYTIVTVNAPTQLTLDRGYVGATGTGKSYVIAARLQPRAPGGVTPRMPNQSPLDLVLLGTLHPAIAQMVGLYWADQKAAPQTSYDYLIVADREGLGGLDPVKILSLLQQSGFSHLDGYIVFNQQMAPASPLLAPADLRVYALPGNSRRTPSGAIQEASNNAGLRWELGVTNLGTLLPGRAIMYHLWRADLGNGATPTAPGRYNLLTKDRPVLVAEPPPGQTPQRASNWPPFPLHAIDSALPGGWYSYQVSGIDIFGRHSPNSGAGPWYQWLPVPDPRPRYYKDPPGNTSIHPFAVQLLDETLPPSLTGIEAYALDPADPTVLRDAAYTAWWNALTASPWYQALSQEAKKNLIGLRVRWLWTAAQMQQAPDTREFRIYYHAGQMNVLLGRTLRVSAVNSTETEVETDLPNTQPANIYVGLWLRVGTDAFAIVASQAGSPLRVRVRNIGPHNDIRPRATAPCTLAIPSRYAAGTVAVTNGSRTVTGIGTNWNLSLAGMPLQVAGEQTVYTVSAVTSPSQLTLERSYGGMTAAGKAYAIRYPLFVDYSAPTAWQERYYVVGYDEHVAVTTDAAGQPLRKYEVFLPAAGDVYRADLPLSPSLAEPIVYAHIGVSAADNKTSTLDDPKWAAGRWGGHAGNEGRIGPPAAVFRVRRELPPAPKVPPAVSDAIRATAADYQGRSFYTYRWRPVAGLQTHIFRALDDTLFKVDWSQRPRTGLDASQVQFFPDATAEPRWDNTKCQQVATELNQLNGFTHDESGTAAAMSAYRGLTNDAMRILSGLPGNERAFTQVTINPLDPTDTANADRRGPDDPLNYAPDPTLRAYLDTLDGRSSSRVLYRALFVDAAHNRSPLSIASAPVQCPDLNPPLAPVITSALGGNQSILLRWAPSAEAGVTGYLIYRATDRDAAIDPRLMTRIADVAADRRIRITAGTAHLRWPEGVHQVIGVYRRDQANPSASPPHAQPPGAVNCWANAGTDAQMLVDEDRCGATLYGLGTLAEETEVAVVFRDARGVECFSDLLPLEYVDEETVTGQDYFYRLVAVRTVVYQSNSVVISSRPSLMVACRSARSAS